MMRRPSSGNWLLCVVKNISMSRGPVLTAATVEFLGRIPRDDDTWPLSR
jgi:hypothetical protein